MKFTVQMKDPDVLYDAIIDAVSEQLQSMSLSDEERQAVKEVRIGKVQQLCRQWFQYGEYLRVQIDTDAETCTVQRTT